MLIFATATPELLVELPRDVYVANKGALRRYGISIVATRKTAAAVVAAQKQLGLSDAGLAERLAAAQTARTGLPASNDARRVRRIREGAHDLTLVELAALAEALEVEATSLYHSYTRVARLVRAVARCGDGPPQTVVGPSEREIRAALVVRRIYEGCTVADAWASVDVKVVQEGPLMLVIG